MNAHIIEDGFQYHKDPKNCRQCSICLNCLSINNDCAYCIKWGKR